MRQINAMRILLCSLFFLLLLSCEHEEEFQPKELYLSCLNLSSDEGLSMLDSIESKGLSNTDQRAIYLLRLMSHSKGADTCYLSEFAQFMNDSSNLEFVSNETFAKIIHFTLENKCEDWEEQILLPRLNQKGQVVDGFPFLKMKLASNFKNKKEFDESRKYYLSARSEFERNNNLRMMERSKYYLALVEKNSGNIDKALALWESILENNDNVADTALFIYTSSEYSAYKRKTEESPFVLEMALLSSKLASLTKKKSLMARAIRNVGKVHYSLGDMSVSLNYLNEALSIAEEIDDTKKITRYLNDIGIVFVDQGKWEEAQRVFRRSLNVAKKLRGNERTLANRYHNIGATCLKTNKTDSAQIYFDQALSLNGDLIRNTDFATDVAELYFEKGRFLESVSRASDALKLAEENEDLNKQIWNLQLLKKCYRILDRQKQYVEVDEKFDKVYQRWQNETRLKETARLQVLHDTEELQRKVDLFTLENDLKRSQLRNSELSRNFWLVCSIGFFFLLLIIIRFWLEQKKKKERTEKLMQELHHRVKNNLEMLSGMFTIQASQTSDEKLRISIAENEARVNAMNLIHSKLYQQNDQLVIDLDAYLSEILENMEDLYTGEKSLSIETEFPLFKINVDKAIVLGLLVNELCTNSFKYAMVSNELNLKCSYRAEEGFLETLTWEDNGEKVEEFESEKGFGSGLIKLLSKQLKAELKISQRKGYKHTFLFKKIKGA